MIVSLFATTSIKLTIVLMIIAVLLPYVCTILCKALGGFRAKDNQSPREFLAKTTGAAARLNYAQLNSFESLPIFLASVIIALYTFVPVEIINMLATGFVLFRLCYIYSYAANLSLFRSVSWFCSLSCCLMLLILSYRIGI
ncbi:Uncharacterized conserved protein, MAPEG superfamily [Moraxella cuniculi DSM 21768]|uniref:Uncharacterized conserved protein, MAPEG superfamily n=2 Tax=Moraxella cuniculi TaxID=34061 RepID=A0A1N7E3G8_9GAMM|nr:MAPEG family protein [Moraxella cuniculi]OOS04646.1 hypothetical protein B0189_08260 [Moraxella cuniculi]SIR82515.1 Uncharacterized conserved protein, MAPEG superfamily [Moraxella cuniculi DSM 21768]VEG12883.1 MAPEG family [Moraxella cuniculi]